MLAALDTQAGGLGGVREIELHRDGSLKSVRLSAENLVDTPSGSLVTAWTRGDAWRRPTPSVTFHPGGAIKALRL